MSVLFMGHICYQSHRINMSLLGNLALLSVTFSMVGIAALWMSFHKVPQLPQILENNWWGPGKPSDIDQSIRSFKINVSQEVLQDLANRLEVTPLLQKLEDMKPDLELESTYLNEILKYWRTKYNWREREEFLNKQPQYKTNIDGLQIHFLHVKPKASYKSPRIVPLLLVHGWPGSVREFYDIIPLLTRPRDDANFVFEVIAPSLPGYGFSDGASKPGLDTAYVAVIMKKLMERLGFHKFYAQGGDSGAAVVANLSTLFPESILGVHSNTCGTYTFTSYLQRILISLLPSVLDESQEDRVHPIQELYYFLVEKMENFHSRHNKLNSIGIALRDSPAGLAAYILEKFYTWTERSEKFLHERSSTGNFKLSDLLDNIMIYWVTRTMTSAGLFSDQIIKAEIGLQIERIPSTVPMGCAMFPQDKFYTTRNLLEGRYPNLVRLSIMPRGGHFPALEEPVLLSNEIWETVKSVEYGKYTFN